MKNKIILLSFLILILVSGCTEPRSTFSNEYIEFQYEGIAELEGATEDEIVCNEISREFSFSEVIFVGNSLFSTTCLLDVSRTYKDLDISPLKVFEIFVSSEETVSKTELEEKINSNNVSWNILTIYYKKGAPDQFAYTKCEDKKYLLYQMNVAPSATEKDFPVILDTFKCK